MIKMNRLNINLPQRALSPALVVALLIAVLAGCGGGDSQTSLTKAQFVQRANAICAQNTGDIVGPVEQYVHSHSNSGQSKEELTADAVRQAILPRFQRQVKEIRALGFPSGDEQQIESFLTSMQQAIDSLDSQQKLDLFTDLDESFTAAKIRAQKYGLTDCL
jgi:hypothetical protein